MNGSGPYQRRVCESLQAARRLARHFMVGNGTRMWELSSARGDKTGGRKQGCSPEA